MQRTAMLASAPKTPRFTRPEITYRHGAQVIEVHPGQRHDIAWAAITGRKAS